MPSSILAQLTSSACRVVYGSEVSKAHGHGSPPWLGVALETLAGAGSEVILPTADEISIQEGFCLFRRGGLAGGFAAAASAQDLESATRDVYRRLFKATRGMHLYRIWNYVPQINAAENELENYRLFCRGRFLAFEEEFGRSFQRLLPAASAVGTTAGPLSVAFLGGTYAPRYFENPLQLPAFRYPLACGPRPPSFSRATVVRTDLGVLVCVSGTAAIRGHATVAPGHLEAQVTCTFENLRSIGEACGVGTALGGNGEWQRTFKVYLRRREDLSRVIKRIESDLLRPGDQVLYLRADICRSELVFEIEARLASVEPHQDNGRHRLPPRP